MAADIILYNAEIVPVGKDQIQHLEITRDIAIKFNHLFGETFIIPESRIDPENMTIPGTDGQKMSKSYGNVISVFGEEKLLRKQIMSIVTDSKELEEPKNPNNCNIFQIYKLLASEADAKDLENKYKKGGVGYGHAKTELLELILYKFKEPRIRFQELMKDPRSVELELKRGAEKAREIANTVLKKVKFNLGLVRA